MEQKFSLHQTQKLVLSPQMRQYLRLLQLPIADLEQAIQQELTENPVLDEAPSPSKGEEEGADRDGPPEENRAEELRFEKTADSLEPMGDPSSNSYTESDLSYQDASEAQKKKDYQESIVTRPEGLSDYLLWQIRFIDLDPSGMPIAQEIIGNIDENGYLRCPTDEIAGSLHVKREQVEEILAKIQELEPPGIAARNLQEALTLQLKRKSSPEAALALQIVEHQMPLLEKRDWKQLAKIFSIDLGQAKQAAELITSLEPRPGRIFYAEESNAVIPDALVTFDEEKEGKLNVEIPDDRIPHLRINPYYRRLLKDRGIDRQTRQFLDEKIQAAMNFIRALSLRKSTIHQITEKLVKTQAEFFEKGFSHLKPLRLKDIAAELGIHESTVSRALQGKYIATPRGTIPYRNFFSSKLDTVTGEAESQKSMIEKIRHLIQSENPHRPLSDQEITDKLREEGVVIARRTVAKYRELMKALPSHLRRK